MMIMYDEKLKERLEAKSLDAKNQALNTVALLDDQLNFSDADMETVIQRLFADFYAYGEQIRKETAELYKNAVNMVQI